LDAKDEVRNETSKMNDAPGNADVKNVTDTVPPHPGDLQNTSDRQTYPGTTCPDHHSSSQNGWLDGLMGNLMVDKGYDEIR
jgi:hypothetical protein